MSPDSLANVCQGRFDRLALRHAARQLRHIGHIAVVLRVKNQVHEETLSSAHGTILHGTSAACGGKHGLLKAARRRAAPGKGRILLPGGELSKEGNHMPVRTAEAEWKGNLLEGQGHMKLGAGAYDGPYSFKSRMETGPGTNPEELIGAAHAGCFSMALSAELGKAGFAPKIGRASCRERV